MCYCYLRDVGILTADQRHRASQGKPGAGAFFPKTLEGLPESSRPLPIGQAVQVLPLPHFQLVQLHPLLSWIMPTPGAIASGRQTSALVPRFLDLCMETGLLVTQGERPVLGTYFPWAV